MITELRVPSEIETRGFVFTLASNAIWVRNLDGDLVSYVRVLDENGHRIIRTQEDFETEVAFWLNDNVPHESV